MTKNSRLQKSIKQSLKIVNTLLSQRACSYMKSLALLSVVQSFLWSFKDPFVSPRSLCHHTRHVSRCNQLRLFRRKSETTRGYWNLQQAASVALIDFFFAFEISRARRIIVSEAIRVSSELLRLENRCTISVCAAAPSKILFWLPKSCLRLRPNSCHPRWVWA